MAATKSTTYRVLSVCVVEGVTYQPNMLVKNLPSNVAEELHGRKMLSDKKPDVDYCKTLKDAVVLDHPKVVSGDQPLKPKKKTEEAFTEDD